MELIAISVVLPFIIGFIMIGVTLARELSELNETMKEIKRSLNVISIKSKFK